jgi:glutamate-1-semialdehyde 2,1-aminomutase
VFNGCYHGAVDETFVRLDAGKAVNKPGLAGEFRDLTDATKVVEFNDIDALEKALAAKDVACVITEPVLTNSCMVLPAPGFHDALRRITRETGTLLLIDETHTISIGPGGYTRKHGLEPDLFVLGKPLAGGVPASIWGMSEEVAARYEAYNHKKEPGYSGIGTTLSANPLQFAAMRATLEEVMTEKNYAHMEKLAARLECGLAAALARCALPWHEFICAPGPLRNGTEAYAAHAPDLEAAIHVALVNRGCLIAPFHNMMLVSPATAKRQVDRLIAAFGDIAEELSA